MDQIDYERSGLSTEAQEKLKRLVAARDDRFYKAVKAAPDDALKYYEVEMLRGKLQDYMLLLPADAPDWEQRLRRYAACLRADNETLPSALSKETRSTLRVKKILSLRSIVDGICAAMLHARLIASEAQAATESASAVTEPPGSSQDEPANINPPEPLVAVEAQAEEASPDHGSAGQREGEAPTVSATERKAVSAISAVTAEAKGRRREGMRRNPRYKQIDAALKEISESRPRTQEEVFRSLDGRRVPPPPAEPFHSARAWMAGFGRDCSAARAWLSKRWSELNLMPLPRGPKGQRK
jgi:hypothetical protein